MKRLLGEIQPYAWGSKDALPQFLGVPATGAPQAELWLGAHPSAPATIDGEPLDAAITAAPEDLVGTAPVQRFGPRLPYLMKVLAAAQPLSLQAHPDREQAEAGFARENAAGIAVDAPERTYRDDWPKPEALCALGEFHALCGFREPAETYRLFAELGVQAAVDLVRPLQSGGPAELRDVFASLLRLDNAADLVDQLVAAATKINSEPGELGDFARTAVEIAGFYPGDPGVLAALIMNRVRLQKYDALYLPAGNLHAYLRGLGVEIMANSDNVLRGGLTSKHIDVDELLRLLDFTPGWAGPVPVVEESGGVYSYRTEAPEFALWRIEIGDRPIDLPADGLGRVVLATDGAVTLTGTATGSAPLELATGQSAFVLPSETVRASGNGTVFVGSPGAA
ncbi:mannose-6-phosphate isomerase, class I [Microlunatus soli]|uniref:mannose-6-phosphate isomerase n=1 Tax=Microlunatus soli TaxID=630515 RepID=A0A1H1RSR3_9ACTN|nr:mannose-6-phosphate isomerase, class I [Microlunatus soli]SDS38748.1 mannose-6-phosphate isomerase, type 1 [Microlunatus soli]